MLASSLKAALHPINGFDLLFIKARIIFQDQAQTRCAMFCTDNIFFSADVLQDLFCNISFFTHGFLPFLVVSIFSLRAFPVHERSLATMNARSFRSQHNTIFVLCQPIHVVFSLLAMNTSVHLSILTRDDSRISRCGAR